MPNIDFYSFDWAQWKPVEAAVLCFIRNKDELLLIRKKTGLGQGKINAPGGRIEPFETPMQAAIREVKEETGIIPINPKETASLSFIFTNGYSMLTTVFITSHYKGLPVETEEAIPLWFSVHSLPFKEMWQDDPYWVPSILRNNYVTGRFLFDEDKLINYEVNTSL